MLESSRASPTQQRRPEMVLGLPPCLAGLDLQRTAGAVPAYSYAFQPIVVVVAR
ncbi:hypothetical protein ABXN37_28145 [Piscinibacter sakaiensis]|uniref:hypothetical protein n=1 Tax=Piscinibacter sakaiensis TaxID=1547922 RepID=UPI003728D156